MTAALFSCAGGCSASGSWSRPGVGAARPLPPARATMGTSGPPLPVAQRTAAAPSNQTPGAGKADVGTGAALDLDAGDTAGMVARWRAALHECGHLVCARHLLGERGVAAVWAGGGVACVAGEDGPARTFRSAVLCECGREAEKLARECPPPAEAPRPLEVADPGLAGRLCERTAAAMDDATAAACWATAYLAVGRDGGRRLNWRDVRQRLVRSRATARAFVREHSAEITTAARRLYLCGLLTLEVDYDDDR